MIGYFDFKVFDIRIIHKVGYLETLAVTNTEFHIFYIVETDIVLHYIRIGVKSSSQTKFK